MRVIRFLVVFSFGAFATGCYTLRPAAGVPPVPGEEVAFDVTDAGRVALGGSMGPEISRIEGLLVGTENEEYLVSIRSVQFLRGGQQRWNGERVGIRREHVGTVYHRRLSRSRSITLGAVAFGGFLAFLASRDMLGLSFGGGDRPEPKPIPVELVRP